MLYKDEYGEWHESNEVRYGDDDTEFTNSTTPFNDLVWRVLQWQRLDKKTSYDGVIALPDDWLDTALFIKKITEKSEGK